MRAILPVLVLSLCVSLAWAHRTNTGYSGAPGSSGHCASSCHGSGTGTITCSGFPANYTPGQAYPITVTRSSGSNVSNFNASCRVGTGSTNAGTIAAGTATTVYNTSGETNGVHMTAGNIVSGTFTWTAPAVGTGTVRLYVAGQQGTSSGPSTALVLISNETPTAPGAARNPSPADSATGVALSPTLTWTAGSGTTSHIVYFGTSTPPDSVSTVTTASYLPGDLQQGTVYYWQIVEHNSVGSTPGPIWQFTALTPPSAADYPDPSNGSEGVDIHDTLRWTPGTGATSHLLYFGTANPPVYVATVTQPLYIPTAALVPNTVYYWRVDEDNGAGTTTGEVWNFTTLAPPDTAANPSPAEGDTAVDVHVTLAWLGPDASAHDVYLGTLNPPPLVSQGQSGSTYTPLQNLEAETVYYWRVNESNGSGMTVGPVWTFRTENVNAARERSSALPTTVALGPCYPNPFNATVSIPFALPKASSVKLALFDITGREVAMLASGSYGAGFHSVQWSSQGVGSGVYLLRLTANGETITNKIMAIK